MNNTKFVGGPPDGSPFSPSAPAVEKAISFDPHILEGFKFMMNRGDSTNVKVFVEKLENNLLSDPTFNKVYQDYMLSQVANYHSARGGLTVIYIKDLLPDADQLLLANLYSTFNLDFKLAHNSDSHAVARAHRKCAYNYLLQLLKLELSDLTRIKPTNGFDVAVKEIGGNPLLQLNNRLVSYHTCYPILSHDDSLRQAKFMSELKFADIKRFTPSKLKIYNEMLNNSSVRICRKKSQNCNITSEKLLSLHSCYDMTLFELAESMVKAKASVMVGCFHFSPDMFIKNEGRLPYTKMRWRIYQCQRTGTKRINFFFESENGSIDMQNTYDHDFNVYISKVVQFREIIIDSNGSFGKTCFLFELLEVKGDTLFFRIHRNVNGTIPVCKVMRTFDIPLLKDKILIQTYQYHTVVPETTDTIGKYFSKISELQPIRLIIPKELYNRVYSFGINLPEGKFTVANLLVAATTFNTRIIVSGSGVRNPDSVEPETLVDFCYTIWILLYIKKYELSRLQKILIDSETDVRAEGKTTTWLKNLIKKLTVPKVIDLEKDIRLKLELPVDSTFDDFSLKFKNLFSNILSFSKRDYPIFVDSLPRFFTISEYLDEFVSNVQRLDRGSSMPNWLEFIPPEPEKLYSFDDFVTCDCGLPLEPVENLGSGFCVFQSCVDAGLAPSIENCIFRLKNSPHLSSVDCRLKVQKLTFENLDDSTNWPSQDIFCLIALEFDIKVCVHKSDCAFCFNDGQVYHFQLTDTHCEYLRMPTILPKIKEFTVALSEKDHEDKTEEYMQHYNKVFASMRASKTVNGEFSKNSFKDSLNYARRATDRYSFLNRGDYINRSALKTIEMNLRYPEFSNIDTVVSIGGPGGEVQYLCENTSAVIYGITLMTSSRESEFDSSLFQHENFKILVGSKLDGNILDKDNRESFSRDILTEHPEGVSHFFGDAAVGCDSNYLDWSLEYFKENTDLVISEADLMSRVLRVGGSGYLKICENSSVNSHILISWLFDNFEKVRIVKLMTSRPSSFERHLILSNFKKKFPFPDFDLVEPTSVTLLNLSEIENRLFMDSSTALNVLKRFFLFSKSKRDSIELTVSDDIKNQLLPMFKRNTSVTYGNSNKKSKIKIIKDPELEVISQHTYPEVTIANTDSDLSDSDDDYELQSTLNLDIGDVSDKSEPIVIKSEGKVLNTDSCINSSDFGKIKPDKVKILFKNDKIFCNSVRKSFRAFKTKFNNKSKINKYKSSFVSKVVGSDVVKSEKFLSQCYPNLKPVDASTSIPMNYNQFFDKFSKFIIVNKSKPFDTFVFCYCGRSYLLSPIYYDVVEFSSFYCTCTNLKKFCVSLKCITKIAIEPQFTPDYTLGITQSPLETKHDFQLVKHSREIKEPIIEDTIACEVDKSEDPNKKFFQSIEEFINLRSKILEHNLGQCKSLITSTNNINDLALWYRKFPGNFGKFSVCKDKKIVWDVPPTSVKEDRNFVYDILDEKIIPSDETLENRSYLVCDYLTDTLDPVVLNTITSSVGFRSTQFSLIDLSLIQACPGAGKTTRIIKDAIEQLKISSEFPVILVATREGRKDLLTRVIHQMGKLKVIVPKDLKSRIRTCASWICNPVKIVNSRVMYIDEALMFHPGELFFAISLNISAKVVRFVGDVKQIPFVNPLGGFVCRYSDISTIVPISEYMFKSYRCPVDVAYVLSSQYKCKENPRGMISAANKFTSVELVHINAITDLKDDVTIKYLCFTQAEKAELRKRGKHVDSNTEFGFYNTSTVHEFQGKEAKKISVVRLNKLKSEEIYLRDNYALVALSRHTGNLVYYTACTEDSLSKFISMAPTSKVLLRSHHEGSSGLGGTVIIDHQPLYSIESQQSYKTFRTTRKAFRNCTDHFRLIPVSSTGPYEDFDFGFPSHPINSLFRSGDDLFVVCSDNPKQKLNLKTFLRSIRSLYTFKGKIYIPDYILKFISAQTLSYNFVKKCENLKPILVLSVSEEPVPYEVFEYANKNCLDQFRPFKPVLIPIYDIVGTIYRRSLNGLLDLNIRDIQGFLDHRFGCLNYVDQTFDAYMVQNGTISYDIGDLTFSELFEPAKIKKFDYLTPVLHSVQPCLRDATQRETLKAFEKRNGAVPCMLGNIDVKKIAVEQVEKFMDLFDKEKLLFLLSEPLYPSVTGLVDWLKDQKPFVVNAIYDKLPIHMQDMAEYNYSIKRSPKPDLNLSATSSYISPQSIVYFEKEINAYYADIWRELKRIQNSSLLPHIMIMTDLSLDDFTEKFNSGARFDKERTWDNAEFVAVSGDDSYIKYKGGFLELDISKYDKSQWYLDLLKECIMMSRFGVDDLTVQFWFFSHCVTKVRDRLNHIKAKIVCQRKSGDPSTYWGNTMKTLMDLNYYLPLHDMTIKDIDKHQLIHFYQKLFNLEIKLFDFKSPYFCSKFFGLIDGRFWFAPDPVKLVTKMGRSDLVNFNHVIEYQRSLVDLTQIFNSYDVCLAVQSCLEDRYSFTDDYTNFLNGLNSFIASDKFLDLFFERPGSVIDYSRLEFHSDR
uniref:Replicase large subunit n=1 Tax=Pimento virga-like virus TaxID=2716740 RepID=A0A6G7PSJ0_9VIRU|nr:polyprotein [Pimento virga-like virus]